MMMLQISITKKLLLSRHGDFYCVNCSEDFSRTLRSMNDDGREVDQSACGSVCVLSKSVYFFQINKAPKAFGIIYLP